MTDGHLDLDALSDVLAEQASPEQVEHLRGCATCSATLADLEAVLGPVRSTLAGLPEPPLPPTLPDRLAAALRDEQATAEPTAAHAAQPAGGEPRAGTATVLPLAPARERRSWKPWAGGAAAAAVLVAGGVLLAQHHGGTSGDAASGTAAGARPASSAELPASTTQTDYTRNGTALRAALPALLRGGAASRPASPAATTTTSGTGTGTSGSSRTAAQLLSSGAVASYGAVGTSAGLASCLQGLQDPGADTAVLALDYARFQGSPALVVLLPGGKAGTIDVFVVRPTCRLADSGLLFYSEVPDPR